MAESIGQSEIKCPTCGSSLQLNPEDVIITCQYCGTAFTAGKSIVKEHLFFPSKVTLKEAEEQIYSYLKRKLRFRGWKSYKGIMLQKLLLPYWVVRIHATSRYRGYLRTTRTETEHYTDSEGKRQTRQKSVTVYEPIDSTIDETVNEPLLCRMGVRIFGLQKLNREIVKMASSGTAEEFSADKLVDNPESIKFLSGEILSREAKNLVKTRLQDRHRAIAHKHTTELFDCRTSVNVESMQFLHYPVISGEYSYGNETYRILIDAHSGKITDAEFPIPFRFRLMNLTIATLSLVGSVLLATNGSLIDPTGGNEFLLIGGQIIAGVLAIFTTKTAWSTHTRK